MSPQGDAGGDVIDVNPLWGTPYDNICAPVLVAPGWAGVPFFTISGSEVWARVEPGAAKKYGETINLMANMNNMHLINPETDLVI